MGDNCCCAAPVEENITGCLICGADIIYSEKSTMQTCRICGRKKLSNAACANGHYICDDCHSYGTFTHIIETVRDLTDKDPLILFEQLTRLPQVHMHGPEHHALVPVVLLTVYRNCGGYISYMDAMQEICKRAKQLPGGTCGYWGVCGAAAGAGIFASVLMGSTPLNEAAWPYPQRLVSDILSRLAETGGPRCCKRTSRIALQESARFIREMTGVEIPIATLICEDMAKNKECIEWRCPFYPQEQ